jgi:hypothetical protein
MSFNGCSLAVTIYILCRKWFSRCLPNFAKTNTQRAVQHRGPYIATLVDFMQSYRAWCVTIATSNLIESKHANIGVRARAMMACMFVVEMKINFCGRWHVRRNIL